VRASNTLMMDEVEKNMKNVFACGSGNIQKVLN
jgi:hypothetical protein